MGVMMVKKSARWTCIASVLSAAVGALSGCGSSNRDQLEPGGQVSGKAPRLVSAALVDADANGSDEGDVVVLRFNREVILQGDEPEGIIPVDAADSFGDDPVLRQSVPGSDRVEVVLGADAVLSPGDISTPGVTKIRVARGTGRVTTVEGTNGLGAAPSEKSVALEDFTAAPPALVGASFVDGDNDGAGGVGDLLVAIFDKPVSVPAGATVAANFLLPVSGDSFGAGATLSAASRQEGNRAVRIALGDGAALTVAGRFSPALTAAGSPSGLEVAAGAGITDTVTASPTPLAAGESADIAAPDATFFGNGREADGVLGSLDPFTSGPSAQGLNGVAGLDSFSGTLSLGGTDFSVDLLFVADRENDRVLIFEDFPLASFAAASWVLGQPDFTTAGSDDPVSEEAPAASVFSMEAPSGVAFDPQTNTLFVADSGNHRLLVFDDLFFEAATGSLAMVNGREASFVLGQASGSGNRANRGEARPGALSFSSPNGLDIDGGRLAVADSGNHRILLFGSLPASPQAIPSTVLGQADFTSGEANRGGAAAGNTLNGPGDVFLSSTFSVNGDAGAVMVADSGNHRVLIFKTGSLASGGAANIVLGQGNFTSSAAALAAARLDSPAGVRGDAGDALIYVADRGNNRVMVYDAAALANGEAGTAIGQADNTSGEPNRGGAPGAGTLSAPGRVAIAGEALVVADTGNHRILAYGGPALPASDADAFLVLGQPSFTTAGPSGHRLNQPGDVLLVAGKLVVADTGNHRVLIYDTFPLAGDPDPDVVLGQADLFSTQPNGGGSPTASTLRLPAGLATDGTRLAVADTGNNRVLIWSSIPAASGAPADLILGQDTPAGALPDAGGVVARNTLDAPGGLAIDVENDRLVVADRDNNRVLIFDGFSALAGFDGAAVVLGQRDFDDREANRGHGPGSNTLRGPRDVLVEGSRLYVADTGNHRVLLWRPIPTGSGKEAVGVFGQADFVTAVKSSAASGTLLEPDGLAMDAGASLLFIADTGHHRIVVHDDLSAKDILPSARAELGQENLFLGLPNRGQDGSSFASLRSPRGLFFNGYELVVVDTGNGRVVVYR